MFGGPGNGKDTSLDTSLIQVGKTWTFLFWRLMSRVMIWALLQGTITTTVITSPAVRSWNGARVEEWGFFCGVCGKKKCWDMENLREWLNLELSGNVRFLSMWPVQIGSVCVKWFSTGFASGPSGDWTLPNSINFLLPCSFVNGFWG